MRSLDRRIDLKLEELKNGWFLISYDKDGVCGTKQVMSREDIREELIDIYHFLRCSPSPKMYTLNISGASKDEYDYF